MNIWTVTTSDDENGTTTSVHLSEKAADEVAAKWVSDLWDQLSERFVAKVEKPEAWQDAYAYLENNTMFAETIEVVAHEVLHPPVFCHLELSTAHVPQGLIGKIACDNAASTTLVGPDGAMLYVPEETGQMEESYPDLVPLYDYARARNCPYILLDWAAETVDDLPTFVGGEAA